MVPAPRVHLRRDIFGVAVRVSSLTREAGVRARIVRMVVALMAATAAALFLGGTARFDGRAFLTAGTRLLEGRAGELYAPVPGAGPFAYQPHAALFFVPFAALGTDAGFTLLVACSAAVLSCVVWKCASGRSGDAAATAATRLRVVAVLLGFASASTENLYLGQIDPLLLWGAIAAASYAGSGRPGLAGALLGVLVSFKPQFALLGVVLLRREVFLRGVAAAAFSWAAGAAAFALYTGSSPGDTADRFREAAGVSRMIVDSAIGPVNQSAASVATMVLVGGPRLGRFYPRTYDPSLLAFPALGFGPAAADVAVWVLRASALLVLGAFVYRGAGRRRGGPRPPKASGATCRTDEAALALCLMPFLSPVFWQVHAVYLLPAALTTARRPLSGPAAVVFYVACALITAPYPYLAGGYAADGAGWYGSHLWAAAGFAVLLVGRRRSDARPGVVGGCKRGRPRDRTVADDEEGEGRGVSGPVSSRDTEP